MVGVAPVSCTISMLSSDELDNSASISFTLPFSAALSACTGDVGVSGMTSSPREDADDCENRVDFVVLVKVDVEDEFEWVRRGDTAIDAGRGRVLEGGRGDGAGAGEGDKSPMASPAAMSLLTPCTPSLMPSKTAPPPCTAWGWSSTVFSKPRLTIRSHLRLTEGYNVRWKKKIRLQNARTLEEFSFVHH